MSKKGINFLSMERETMENFSNEPTDRKAEILQKCLNTAKYKFIMPLLFSINPQDEKVKVYAQKGIARGLIKQLEELFLSVKEWSNADETVEIEFFQRKGEQLKKERQTLLEEFMVERTASVKKIKEEPKEEEKKEEPIKVEKRGRKKKEKKIVMPTVKEEAQEDILEHVEEPSDDELRLIEEKGIEALDETEVNEEEGGEENENE